MITTLADALDALKARRPMLAVAVARKPARKVRNEGRPPDRPRLRIYRPSGN